MAINSNYTKILLVFIIFFGLSFFIYSIIEIKLLSITIFIFGLFIAFALDNKKRRFEAIKNNLRLQDAKLLNVYELSKHFDEKTKSEVQKRIENYLIMQLDCNLEDIDNSGTKLSALLEYVGKIKTKNQKLQKLWEMMVENLLRTREILKEVSHNIKDKMTNCEWFALLLLFFSVIFLVYQENKLASIYSKVFVAILLTCFTFFILILRQLDTLNWQEQKWIWKPLISLFKELEIKPYLPEAVLLQKRLNLNSIKGLDSIRVGRFTHPYPDFSDKKIEIINL